MRTRVLLADAHNLFRAGMSALLRARGIEIVAEASDGASALEMARRTCPDLVLADAELPGLDAWALTRRLRRELPQARVILLTEVVDRVQLLAAVKSGVQGCMLKDTETETFLALLSEAARGGTPLSPPLAAVLLRELSERLGEEDSNAQPVNAELNTREREILALIAKGMTNRDVAARLHLSENTIKYHLKNISQKWHLHTRAQAVAYALQTGALEPMRRGDGGTGDK